MTRNGADAASLDLIAERGGLTCSAWKTVVNGLLVDGPEAASGEPAPRRLRSVGRRVLDVTIDFDIARSWADVERLRASIASERQRHLLQVVIDHIKAELVQDLDAILATLVAEPNFHIWAAGRDIGPKGAEATRRYYEAFISGGGAIFESVKERILVDDRTVAHEGPVRTLLPGKVARMRGYQVPDESAHYLVRFRNCVWWSFDEAGLALGEDSLTSIDLTAWELVPADDLPRVYLDYVAGLP